MAARRRVTPPRLGRERRRGENCVLHRVEQRCRPEGNHNSGTSSVTIHIDETPPSISLEPQNPNDPTGLVVDTSDTQSGVGGGSIEMAPAGSGSWTSLPTTLHRKPIAGALRRRWRERRVHVQRSILRQRRQLRLNRSDRDAAGPDSGHLGGERRATPATRCASPRAKHDGCTAGARPAPAGQQGSTGWGVWSRTRIGRRSSSGLAPRSSRRQLAAEATFTGSSVGSAALSLSHQPDQQPIDREGKHATEAARQSCGTPAARLAPVRGSLSVSQ